MSDAFYTSLEEKFRGEPSDIKNRLRVYLPFVLPTIALSPDAAIFDLGCGRGEWLTLMQEQGISATGIDMNALSVQGCQSKGLNALHADAMATLDELDENSVAVITGFHIAEHLTFEVLLELCFKAIRALIPGGLLILETPNPENILVGSHTFYLDPSHQRPLPPLLLDHIFDHVGFSTRKTLRLQEPDTPEDSDTLQDRLQSVSPDYALIGQKRGSKEHLEHLAKAFSLNIGSPPSESQLTAPLMPTDILEDIRISLTGSNSDNKATADIITSLPETLDQLSKDILSGQDHQKTTFEKSQELSDSRLNDFKLQLAALSETPIKQNESLQKLTDIKKDITALSIIQEKQDFTSKNIEALNAHVEALNTTPAKQDKALRNLMDIKSEIIALRSTPIKQELALEKLLDIKQELTELSKVKRQQDVALQNIQVLNDQMNALSSTPAKQDQAIENLIILTDQVKMLVTQSQIQQEAIRQQQGVLLEKSEKIADQNHSLRALHNRITQMDREHNAAQHVISNMQAERENLDAHFKALKNERDAIVTSLQAIGKSTSWRVTKPLRFLGTLLRSPRRAAYSVIRNLDTSLKRTPRLRAISIKAAKRAGLTREKLTQEGAQDIINPRENFVEETSLWAVRPPHKRTDQWLKILGSK